MSSLNRLKGYPLDVVFVGLNPTEKAKENGAIFSNNRGFWNILDDSRLTTITKNVNKTRLADEIFEKHNYSGKNKYGFADLVDDCYDSKSNNVTIPAGAVEKLVAKLAEHKTKKIALMGQKVTDAFFKAYPEKIKGRWRELGSIKIKEGKHREKTKKIFGQIGSIRINKHEMKIYAMPFPVNSSIPDKHKDYSKLL
ncbi:uracil-DNA glycosylase family protein [Ancylomarina sp. 16SWW S1-10-2]|uniref:uracil-DNA glycosylase family protein n=1 Tax=Ancylomarina sp. 16SWW S1-10-2 TaxID=2499681 RepID=UPI0012AE7FD5|nr:uracil-DNA glycosylase family protein [Ancylomarina sp. 16SWW S1-10-2]MRT92077.1 hypothetical protein [Ancylomarina sp. 16SWW S1-10-2]